MVLLIPVTPPAYLQRTGVNNGRTGIGICAGKDHSACAGLGEVKSAADFAVDEHLAPVASGVISRNGAVGGHTRPLVPQSKSPVAPLTGSPKAKFALMVIGVLSGRVTVAPLVLPIAPPLMINVPLPKALGLLIFNVPLLSVVAPVVVLAPGQGQSTVADRCSTGIGVVGIDGNRTGTT